MCVHFLHVDSGQIPTIFSYRWTFHFFIHVYTRKIQNQTSEVAKAQPPIFKRCHSWHLQTTRFFKRSIFHISTRTWYQETRRVGLTRQKPEDGPGPSSLEAHKSLSVALFFSRGNSLSFLLNCPLGRDW